MIRYCDRPFETKIEHDEALIKNWNSLIKKEDHVYHLGDFAFGNPTWIMDKIAGRLRGHIHLIKGNHDKGVIKEPLAKRFEFVKDVHFLKTKLKNETVMVFMSHYAHRVWPQKNYGVYMAYGHSHSRLPPIFNSMDVGVDAHNYFPITLEQFIEKVKLNNQLMEKTNDEGYFETDRESPGEVPTLKGWAAVINGLFRRTKSILS